MFYPKETRRKCKTSKKNKQKKYVSTLKEILKSCETNPIESGPAKIIIIGLETWS